MSKTTTAKATTKNVEKKTPKAKKAAGTHRKPDDGCRAVAKASDGKLNSAQVRILRFLKTQKKPVDRTAIKVGVGIGAEGLYSADWLHGLWALDNSKWIKIEEHEPTEGKAKHWHSITMKGKELLEKCEKSAKEDAKAK